MKGRYNFRIRIFFLLFPESFSDQNIPKGKVGKKCFCEKALNELFIPLFVFRFGQRSYKNTKILRDHVCLLFLMSKAKQARQKFNVKKITQPK